MRTKKVIINTTVAVLFQLLIFVMGILVRRLFLKTFPLDYLGYEGLFTSIFSVLGIAEMGAGGMFSYMLYAALTKKDKEEVSVIMGMYQKLYMLIGAFVFFAGAILFFFLPAIIQNSTADWEYIRFIYIIQFASTLITYFLAYRRALLIADQFSYRVVLITSLYECIAFIARIVAIVYLQSYIVYLFVPLIKNLLINIHIAIRSNKLYPGVFGRKASWNDFKIRDAFTQLKALLVSRVSNVIYSSTDAILISAITGVTNVGLFSNYSQFNDAAKNILSYFSEAIEKSTGNLVYSEGEKKKVEFFDALDFLSFIIGVSCFCICCNIFQKVITFTYGVRFLLPEGVGFTLGLDFYVRCRGMAYCSFQSAVGHYEKSKWFSVAAAISNIFFSILFGLKWGITGILLATVFGNIFIQIGRARVVYEYLFPRKVIDEIAKELIYLALAMVCVWLSYRISSTISASIIGICVSLLIGLLLPIVLIFSLYFKSNRFKLIIAYSKNVLITIKHTRKES